MFHAGFIIFTRYYAAMQSRLIVKNFGPIEFVDLDLRNVNVFIGPQASGKSALAKLFTIFKAPRKFLNEENLIAEMILGKNENDIASFKNVLIEYNILSFLKKDTEIEFDSELHSLSYKRETITYEPKLLKRIQNIERLKGDFENNKEQIKNEIRSFHQKSFFIADKIYAVLSDSNEYMKPIEVSKGFQDLKENNFLFLLKVIKEIEVNFSTHAALYIPSERNLINIIKNAALNLLNNNVPIPKHILSFGAEVEKAKIQEIDLGFLHENLFYRKINGKDRIFTDTTNSIELTEAASGIQSVVPILISILSQPYLNYYQSFVIEEPELNLFPFAQYELIQELESIRKEYESEGFEGFGAIHTYTTHSPYILSALNNLLYANKVIKLKGEKLRAEVTKIIPTNIDPNYFTAYQIKNGKAESIFDREKGLIIDNYIDDVADEMGDDFDALTRLMK